MSQGTAGYRLLKKLGRDLLRKHGRDLIPFDPRYHYPLRRRMLFEAYNINLVLDVGGSDGGYAGNLRSLGYQGRIVSFEPLAYNFAKLQTRSQADGAWEAMNCALGNEERTAEINVAGNYDSSSLLPMLALHAEYAPESQYVGKEQIKVTTLDKVFASLCSPGQGILLKIDTQGSEQSVIEGAARSLAWISTIQVEMSLVPLYEGELLIHEMCQLLYGKGYCLVSIEPGFTDRQTGRLFQVDGIFHRF
jgi:FkbM family methyltransferase